MKSRVFALALAVGVALVMAWGRASAQQPVNTWTFSSVDTICADTLARFSADSVVTTRAIPIQGARAIVVHAWSSGTDTITIVPQVRFPNYFGAPLDWIGTGAGVLFGVTQTGSVNLTTTGKVAWMFTTDITAGGTPTPLTLSDIRFRIKSADARRYATASSATLAATGTIRMVVYVLR